MGKDTADLRKRINEQNKRITAQYEHIYESYHGSKPPKETGTQKRKISSATKKSKPSPIQQTVSSSPVPELTIDEHDNTPPSYAQVSSNQPEVENSQKRGSGNEISDLFQYIAQKKSNLASNKNREKTIDMKLDISKPEVHDPLAMTKDNDAGLCAIHESKGENDEGVREYIPSSQPSKSQSQFGIIKKGLAASLAVSFALSPIKGSTPMYTAQNEHIQELKTTAHMASYTSKNSRGSDLSDKVREHVAQLVAPKEHTNIKVVSPRVQRPVFSNERDASNAYIRNNQSIQRINDLIKEGKDARQYIPELKNIHAQNQQVLYYFNQKMKTNAELIDIIEPIQDGTNNLEEMITNILNLQSNINNIEVEKELRTIYKRIFAKAGVLRVEIDAQDKLISADFMYDPEISFMIHKLDADYNRLSEIKNRYPKLNGDRYFMNNFLNAQYFHNLALNLPKSEDRIHAFTDTELTEIQKILHKVQIRTKWNPENDHDSSTKFYNGREVRFSSEFGIMLSNANFHLHLDRDKKFKEEVKNDTGNELIIGANGAIMQYLMHSKSLVNDSWEDSSTFARYIRLKKMVKVLANEFIQIPQARGFSKNISMVGKSKNIDTALEVSHFLKGVAQEQRNHYDHDKPIRFLLNNYYLIPAIQILGPVVGLEKATTYKILGSMTSLRVMEKNDFNPFKITKYVLLSPFLTAEYLISAPFNMYEKDNKTGKYVIDKDGDKKFSYLKLAVYGLYASNNLNYVKTSVDTTRDVINGKTTIGDGLQTSFARVLPYVVGFPDQKELKHKRNINFQ